MSESIVEVGSSNFESVVLGATIPVIVDFWAPWCGPCKQALPVLEKLAEEYQGKVLVTKVNVDKESVLSGKFSIRSIPTMIAFRDGKELQRTTGFSGEVGIRALMERSLA